MNKWHVISSIDGQPVFDWQAIANQPLVKAGRRTMAQEAKALAKETPPAHDGETLHAVRVS